MEMAANIGFDPAHSIVRIQKRKPLREGVTDSLPNLKIKGFETAN